MLNRLHLSRAQLASALAAGFAGMLSAGSVGCDVVDCGPGTIESQGSCVPADQAPDDAKCGLGTKLGPAGTCIPEVEVVCDDLTTTEVIDPETGVVTCVGSGGGMGCDDELVCGTPSNGKISICGRLYDTQTDAQIREPGAMGAQCDPMAPTADGPCSIKLVYVDALEFAMNPSAATPHVGSPMFLDNCGRFKAVDLPLSSFGFTGIAIDDQGSNTRLKLTGVALDDDNAKPANRFRGYDTRNETDTAWSSTSGITGQSFATRGVLAAVFKYRDLARAGVAVRREGQLIPADDYYFSDTAATRNTVVAAQTLTGMNGTALVINSPAPANHDGVNAEPAGCRWPSSLAASIPGVVFMQIKAAETNGGVECP